MEDDDVFCSANGCAEERVSGSEYCEDHYLEQQVMARTKVQHISGGGTLADMIRNAKGLGYITPVTGYW